MNCRRFEERLNELLDARGEPNRDPHLCAHADQCASCRELLDLHDALWQVLPSSHVAEQELSERVDAPADHENAPRVKVSGALASEPRSGWRFHPLTSAVALLWLWLQMSYLPGAHTARDIEVARVGVPVGAPSMAVAANSESDGVDADRLESEPRWWQWQVSGWETLAMMEPTHWVEPVAERIIELPRDQLLVMGEVSEGMRPLAESFTAAMQLLLRSWSSARSEMRELPPPIEWNGLDIRTIS